MSDEMSADPHADSHEGFHTLRNEAEEPYGSIEIFWHDADVDTGWERGWYWWACYPGYLPDGDSYGPFATSEEADADARAT